MNFLPFRRIPRSPDGEEAAPVCSEPSPTQRQWEVLALLSTLSPLVREALYAWLIAPTDLNLWPPPVSFSRRRAPIDWDDVAEDVLPTCGRLLLDELRAIRQTLDFPPEALSGLTRNGLLIAHAIRLRQLERWLCAPSAARQIRRLIASAPARRVA